MTIVELLDKITNMFFITLWIYLLGRGAFLVLKDFVFLPPPPRAGQEDTKPEYKPDLDIISNLEGDKQ